MTTESKNLSHDLVGVIPAAGRATRMGKIPCSKEILPIALHNAASGSQVRVLGDLLIDEFAKADVGQAVIATAPSKLDIERFFGVRRDRIGLEYVYLDSESTVHTIDACSARVVGRTVVFGFPDLVLPPSKGYRQLLARQQELDADVVLGLFGTSHPHMMDMVKCADDGRVLDIAIKPLGKSGEYAKTWCTAVWGDRFTTYIHEHLERASRTFDRELYVGDLLLAAIGDGLDVFGLVLSDQDVIDAGTPETYAWVIRHFSDVT